MMKWLSILSLLLVGVMTPVASPVSPTELGDGTYDWSLAVPSDWTVREASAGWHLENGVSTIDLQVTTAYHGSQMDCVLGEMNAIKSSPETKSASVWKDDPNVPAAEMEQGRSAMTYVVTRSDDEDDVVRIDCITVKRGEADLVVRHRAPRGHYAVERRKADALRAAIDWKRP